MRTPGLLLLMLIATGPGGHVGWIVWVSLGSSPTSRWHSSPVGTSQYPPQGFLSQTTHRVSLCHILWQGTQKRATFAAVALDRPPTSRGFSIMPDRDYY